MWMPVCGPIPEFRISVMGSMIYLFLQSVVPTIPAAWLTFAEDVVYKSYDTPVRLWGISAVEDQQLAGAAMKVGGGIFLWAIIVFLFFKRFAARHADGYDYRRGRTMPDAEIVGHDEEPLTTADVEREFATSSTPPRAALSAWSDMRQAVRHEFRTVASARRDRRPPDPHGLRGRSRRTRPPAQARGARRAGAGGRARRPAARHHERARRPAGPRQRAVEAGRRAPPARARPPQAEALQDESRDDRRARRSCSPTSTTRSASGSARNCWSSPTCPTPTRPTARATPTIRSSRGRSCPSRSPTHQRVPHWETATALGILDNERATKIAQSMWTMQRGAGATLARALCQLALDRNADAFEEIRPPTLVSTATLTVDRAAAEVRRRRVRDRARRPVVHPHRRGAAHVDLRRRGARRGRSCRCGSWRTARATGARRARPAATRAACCAPTSSTRSRSSPSPPPSRRRRCSRRWSVAPRRTIAALGLPYRIIEICTGDMGQSHHRSFDIEVYAPGADQWLEVSSVSWFSDYQARRANIRYRPVDADGRPQKGTAAGAHAQRLGARRAARVGGDRRELPQRRRLGHRARCAAAVHARHQRRSHERATTIRDRRVQYETAGIDVADMAADPMEQWRRWHGDAFDAGRRRAERDDAVDGR